jgi:hypothetical protein
MEIQVLNYENACWHGGNSSYVVAIRSISTFAPCWIWCQIHFFWKINEVTWKLGWNTSYLVATRWVLFSSLLSLVSNLGSCWKFMQLHEKMVEIHPIWWPLNGFCFPTCWVWFQIQLFVENLCKLHEKNGWNICPIWWPPDVFWPPFVYWIKSRIEIKV